MIQVQTLGMLLRSLRPGDASSPGPLPVQAVAAAQVIRPISSQNTRSGETAARDAASDGRHALAAASTPAPLIHDDAPGMGPSRAPAASVPDAAQHAWPSPSAIPQSRTVSGAASLSLSPAGHLLDALARLPGGKPITPATPLVPQSAATTEAIAQALQHSIVTSGVFYESHLARWAIEGGTEATLRAQPQASWGAAVGGEAPGAAAAATTAVPEAQSQSVALVAGATPAAEPNAEPRIAADGGTAICSLLRQQLDVLETGQLLWRGELWPGQAALIEIADDARHDGSAQAPVWRTRLVLALPALGTFEARVALAGQRIHLVFDASDGRRAAFLGAALPELATALGARGLDLAPVRVGHE